MADLFVIGDTPISVPLFTMRSLSFLLTFLAFPAIAQDGLRPSDTVMTQAELTELLGNRQLEFYDGSKSRYSADGSYGYTYTDDGPVWAGQYQVFDNSRVCVDFDNGSNRCDQLVKDGETVVLIIENGTRFPVRNLTVYQQ